MRSATTATVCAFLLVSICAGQDQRRDLDPCQEGQVATLGKPYVVGFAYLPGGDVSDWEAGKDANNITRWRNPCNPTDREALEAGQVMTSAAVYSLKVETLQLLRTDAGLDLLARAFASPSQVLTVVAYNGDFVTEPRVLVSNEPGLTQEAGSVISIPLILQFSGGKGVVPFWSDRECGTCSDDLGAELAGTNDFFSGDFQPGTSCVNSISCAVDIESCAECLRGGSMAQQAACLSLCTTSFNVGWAGTDSNLQPMISSYVITQSDDFAFAGLFTEQVLNAANKTQGLFQTAVAGISAVFNG